MQKQTNLGRGCCFRLRRRPFVVNILTGPQYVRKEEISYVKIGSKSCQRQVLVETALETSCVSVDCTQIVTTIRGILNSIEC